MNLTTIFLINHWNLKLIYSIIYVYYTILMVPWVIITHCIGIKINVFKIIFVFLIVIHKKILNICNFFFSMFMRKLKTAKLNF